VKERVEGHAKHQKHTLVGMLLLFNAMWRRGDMLNIRGGLERAGVPPNMGGDWPWQAQH